MSVLLGKDMLKELRTVADRWSYEVEGKPKIPILSAPDETYAAVEKTFQLRHIICHETTTKYRVAAEDIERGFEATALFLKASDELVNQTLASTAPLTQADMNAEAGRQLAATLAEIDTLIARTTERLESGRVEQLTRTHAAWRAYMEASAEFMADYYKGDTMRPMIYAGSANSLAHTRVEKLRKLAQRYERADGHSSVPTREPKQEYGQSKT